MGKIAYLILFMVSLICEGYKILAVFPFPARSQAILGEGYVRNLLDNGHEVTYITPFPIQNSNPKLHQVDVSENMEEFETDIWTFEKIANGQNVINMKRALLDTLWVFRLTVENAKIQALMNDHERTFDLVILQWIVSDAYVGFAAVYNCPFIWANPYEPHWMVLRFVHEKSNPAFNADLYSVSVPPFDFIRRVENLIYQLYTTGLIELYIQPYYHKAFYKELFGPVVAKKGRELPPYEEILYNASLIVSISHVALGQPISQPQNSIEIGGYHIDTNTKPLPQDLQKIMDEAKHGVVYFSMGTHVKSKEFPEALKMNILKVFGKLKQTVIWKFEDDMVDKPNNVHIVKWAPQISILAHPNCRLFITHGGLLSITETLHFGVPAIVMPTSTDQYMNAERVVKKGFGVKVEVSYQMAGKMKTAIEEVLSNPKYKERVEELSMIYHDRVAPPGRVLVHWVEHVARTRGAPHLRSPALMLPWYQKMYLDLALVVLAIILMTKYACKMIKQCFSRNRVGSQKKIN